MHGNDHSIRRGSAVSRLSWPALAWRPRARMPAHKGFILWNHVLAYGELTNGSLPFPLLRVAAWLSLWVMLASFCLWAKVSIMCPPSCSHWVYSHFHCFQPERSGNQFPVSATVWSSVFKHVTLAILPLKHIYHRVPKVAVHLTLFTVSSCTYQLLK